MGGSRLIVAPAEADALPSVVEQLEEFFDEHDLPLKAANQALMCLDEVFANIAEHAYSAPAFENTIGIEAVIDGDQLVMTVSDQGRAFDPLGKDAPDVTLALEDRPIGGLGIHLVRNIMDEVRYERINGENRLTLIKRLR